MSDYLKLADEVEARVEFAATANVDAMIASGGGREWHTSYVEDVPRLASAIRELHRSNVWLEDELSQLHCRIEELEEENKDLEIGWKDQVRVVEAKRQAAEYEVVRLREELGRIKNYRQWADPRDGHLANQLASVASAALYPTPEEKP